MQHALADLYPPTLEQRPKSDYRPVVSRRVDTHRWLERIRTSTLRLPGIDYAQLLADAEHRIERIPLFLVVNLARVHEFVRRAG
jgi:hypothetical protein